MTVFVVCVGEGKGTWGFVSQLISSESWERIIIVTTSYFKEKFVPAKTCEFVVCNEDSSLDEISAQIQKSLNNLFGDVAVNFVSGSGKLHMATMSALLKAGVGIRLVGIDSEKKIKEL